MTDDFNAHDLRRLHAMEKLLLERGLARDQRGFWFDPHAPTLTARRGAAAEPEQIAVSQRQLRQH